MLHGKNFYFFILSGETPVRKTSSSKAKFTSEEESTSTYIDKKKTSTTERISVTKISGDSYAYTPTTPSIPAVHTYVLLWVSCQEI